MIFGVRRHVAHLGGGALPDPHVPVRDRGVHVLPRHVHPNWRLIRLLHVIFPATASASTPLAFYTRIRLYDYTSIRTTVLLHSYRFFFTIVQCLMRTERSTSAI